jgi:hypothetical protein
MPDEKIGETLQVETADHPARKDSPEYLKSREWLMSQAAGGCYICEGPVDMDHPAAPEASKGTFQDHHGGGLYIVKNGRPILVGFNLFPMEWSMGWGADPARISTFIKNLQEAGFAQDWTKDIGTTADVMNWVDSIQNANVKLCAPHHVGHETSHTPDHNGHEAVGIHNGPWPVLAAQAFYNWSKFDLFAGTTGTIAVSPHPDMDGKTVVQHVSPLHPTKNSNGTSLQIGQELPKTHPHSRAAHAGYQGSS